MRLSPDVCLFFPSLPQSARRQRNQLHREDEENGELLFTNNPNQFIFFDKSQISLPVFSFFKEGRGREFNEGHHFNTTVNVYLERRLCYIVGSRWDLKQTDAAV